MAAVGGSAWTGARRDHSALKNFNALVQSPDDEQRWDRATLLARATDLERSDPLAGGAINEAVLSVVGTGLSAQPEPLRRVLGWSQDQAVECAEDLKQRFNLWAGDARECDIARRRNFYQQQVIAYRTCQSRGDVFALLPRRRYPGGIWSLKVQLVEGDRCCMPKGVTDTDTHSQGVELDPATGGALAYSFCRKHPASLGLTPKDWTTVQAWDKDGQRQVLHLLHEHRIDLRRGYPMLAPVILPLKQMSLLSDAELNASIVSSLFALGIERPAGGGSGLLGNLKKDENGQKVTEINGAALIDFAPGEKIVALDPVRPNGAFDPFWRSFVGRISMRVGIPPEVLLKKYESSYTAARAALLQFYRWVTVERENLLAPDFCQPIYEAWLAEEVASGRVSLPGFFRDPMLRAAYCACRWVGDGPAILDPLKEVMAAEEMVDYGFSTYSEQTMRLNGGDFEANHERLSREVRMRRRDGLITDLKPEAFENLDATKGAPTDTNPDQQDEEDTQTKLGSGRRAQLLALALRETR
jgi:lambda family phage portal protein